MTGSRRAPGHWYGVYHKQIDKLCAKLEAAYKDMVDIEFTVQKGELFVLQSRTGKRSAKAAFSIGVDLVKEERHRQADAVRRITESSSRS